MSRLLKLKRQVIEEANKRVLNEQSSDFKKSVDFNVTCPNELGIDKLSINFTMNQIDENSYEIKILNKSNEEFWLTDILSWDINDDLEYDVSDEIWPNEPPKIVKVGNSWSNKGINLLLFSFAINGEGFDIDLKVKFEDGGLIYKGSEVKCY